MTLRVDRRGRVAILTLDDPERRNALTGPLVDDIVARCDELEVDEGVGALVVTGTDPAFCAGADLGDLMALRADGDPDALAASLRGIYEGFLRIRRCPLPVVAAVNGPAVGAGFNLALAADVRVVSPVARFDARFLEIGLHPGGGHAWLLERAVGPQAAAAVVLFGERLDGEAAVRVGLAWECVPLDALLDRAVELAEQAASIPRPLAARAKQTLRDAAFQPDFDAAVATEVDRQVWSVRSTRK